MVVFLYTDYKVNDKNVKDYQKYEYIINTIKRRFTTYGYKRIKTPAFEQYDLYSRVTSSINQNEMIKVIDYTGDVLVLRPDVTIPITRELAQDFEELSEALRYFYIQDVFRQTFDRADSIENTQAGVEYFGENSPEADAEVIALACHTLMDLGFKDIKLEIGDAGFFNTLIDEFNLNEREQMELRKLIQAKNAVDIRPFLDRLDVDHRIAETIEQIPFLYGKPQDVCDKAKALHVTEKITAKLDHLLKVNDILKMYDLEDKVVMDLGLINHMGYYSGVIFQGFVDKIGEPVLMGGRYDKLAKEFGVSIPAIGFACKVDALVKATANESVPKKASHDVHINYKAEDLKSAIEIANALRSSGYSVTSCSSEINSIGNRCSYIITIKAGNYHISHENKSYVFSDIRELCLMIEGGN